MEADACPTAEKRESADEEEALLAAFRIAGSRPGGADAVHHVSLQERVPGVQALPECTCVSLVKRGRYSEAKCEAHKLTLRNSRPHADPLGAPVPCLTLSTSFAGSRRRALPSPSRTPLTALLASPHPSSAHKKPTMKESQSLSALPPRSPVRDLTGPESPQPSTGRVASGCGLLDAALPSLATTALLHLAASTRSPSARTGQRTSYSASKCCANVSTAHCVCRSVRLRLERSLTSRCSVTRRSRSPRL